MKKSPTKKQESAPAFCHFVIALAEAAVEPEERDANARIHRSSGTIAAAFRGLISAGESAGEGRARHRLIEVCHVHVSCCVVPELTLMTRQDTYCWCFGGRCVFVPVVIVSSSAREERGRVCRPRARAQRCSCRSRRRRNVLHTRRVTHDRAAQSQYLFSFVESRCILEMFYSLTRTIQKAVQFRANIYLYMFYDLNDTTLNRRGFASRTCEKLFTKM